MLEGLDGAELEGELVGVHGVEATVEQRNLEALHGISGKHTVLHRCLETLLYAGDTPLAEMFGYVTALRTITSGRATSTMTFDHYSEVSNSIAKNVLTECQGRVDLVELQMSMRRWKDDSWNCSRAFLLTNVERFTVNVQSPPDAPHRQ